MKKIVWYIVNRFKPQEVFYEECSIYSYSFSYTSYCSRDCSRSSSGVIFPTLFLGYNSSWYVIGATPITSTNGITGINNSTWSSIGLPINSNEAYEIQLDIIVNNASVHTHGASELETVIITGKLLIHGVHLSIARKS